MTLQEWIDKNTGQPMDFDGKYGNQCVDLFRFYLQDVLNVPQPPGVKGAKDLSTNYDPKYFEWVKNTDGVVPSPGDILIFDASAGNPFGHVSVDVKADLKLKTFQSFDINFPSEGYKDKDGNFIGTGKAHIQTHKWTEPVLGWLVYKKPESATTQPDNVGKTYTEEEMTKMRLERDENYNKLQTEVSNHEKDLTDIAVGIGSTNTVPGILARVKTLTDIEEQLRQAQVEAQKQQEKFDQEKADLQRQITELKGIIETKQKEYDTLLQRVQTLEGKVTNNGVKQTFLDKLLALLKG